MKRYIFTLMLLLFILPANIHACIMIFYRYEPALYEISHRSIIIYDREAQKVGLVPQISFRGRPQDFCIVVPTPSVPKLNTVSQEVFYDAELLTSPIQRERGTGCFFSRDLIGGAEEKEEPASRVEIINEQSIGGFSTVTLSAADPDALIKWLQENKYNYSVQDKDVIDYYTQRGWVFTVMKIDTASMPTTTDYYRYNNNPVLFRYSASSLIYPIRLASINSGDKTDIVTYVLSNSKMTFPGARVEYANRIDDRELKEINKQYPAFGGLIGQHRFLTKLRRTFSIMEMDADIEIVPAPDNDEFRDVIYYGFSPAADLVPLGMAAVLFLAFRLLRKKRKEM